VHSDTTSNWRMRRDRDAPDPRVPTLRVPVSPTAGTVPKINPAATAVHSAKTSTGTLMLASFSLGTCPAPAARMTRTVDHASARPAAPPINASRRLSTINWPTSRPREAPIACRTINSC
jgi:hypothetical protein